MGGSLLGALTLVTLSLFQSALPFPTGQSEMGHEQFWSNAKFMETLTDYLTSSENLRKTKAVTPTLNFGSNSNRNIFFHNQQQPQQIEQNQQREQTSAFSELAEQLAPPDANTQGHWRQFPYPSSSTPDKVSGRNNNRNRDTHGSESVNRPLSTFSYSQSPSASSVKSIAHTTSVLKEIPVFSVDPTTTQTPQKKKSRRNRQKKQKQTTTTTTPAPRGQDIYDDEDFDGEDYQDDIDDQSPLLPARDQRPLPQVQDQSPRQQIRDQDEGQNVQSQHIIASTIPQRVAGPQISQQNQNSPPPQNYGRQIVQEQESTFPQYNQQQSQVDAPQYEPQSDVPQNSQQFGTFRYNEQPEVPIRLPSNILIATMAPEVTSSAQPSNPFSDQDLENGLEKKPNLMNTLGGLIETGRKILYLPRGVVDVVDHAMNFAEQNPYVGFVMDKVADKLFGSTKSLTQQQPQPQPQNVQSL